MQITLSSLVQVTVVNAFALIVCTLSAITWVVIGAKYAKERGLSLQTAPLTAYFMLGAFLSAYFGLGYALILGGVSLSPETYFRPMLLILIPAYTTSGVFLYLDRLQVRLQRDIEAKLEEAWTELKVTTTRLTDMQRALAGLDDATTRD